MFRASSILQSPQAILTLAGLLGLGSLCAGPLPELRLAFHPAASDSVFSYPAASHPTANPLYAADERAFSDDPAYKSPGAALVFSLLGTSVPVLAVAGISNGSGGGASMVVLLLAGLIGGPSAGQFYADSPASAVLGMAFRTAGMLIAISGLSDALHTCDEYETNCRESSGETKMTIGMLTLLGGTLYSIIDAPLSAFRFNERQPKKPGFGWSPTLSPGSDGAWKTGAMAWMRF